VVGVVQERFVQERCHGLTAESVCERTGFIDQEHRDAVVDAVGQATFGIDALQLWATRA